ncbi:MAG: hypothetical protein WKF29_04850 [Thermoleophilaceae bacterium]
MGATATSAQAVHWPFFGGDNGRSGYQPVGEGKAPVRFLYSKTGAFDRFIKTSVLTTTGMPATQRVIYGTVDPQEAMTGAPAVANGRVHLRVLGSGAAVGSENGVLIDDGNADADVFGPGAAAPEPASVSFADTSGPTGLGQVFAVHNDDDQSLTTGDIAIAQIDEATGTLVKQQPLAGTQGFSIRSSVVATGPAPDGSRVLFFVAENGDDERLFRVPVTNAATTSAAFGMVSSTGDIDADPQASPAIVFLRNGSGSPVGHVAVGTSAPSSNLRTFVIGTLAPGPVSADLGDDVQTASVPIQPDGMTPNPMGRVTTAPAIYVAARVGDTTQVHRLSQPGNAQTLATTATSSPLAGRPAPALATDQESEPNVLAQAKVIVTTASNLYLLNTEGLAGTGTLSATALSPGTSGFGQTTAAASGDLAYVTNDEGAQAVIGLSDAKPVPPADFTEDGGNAAPRLAKSGMGQPSISRSFVQYGSQKGLFVYTNACGNNVPGTPGNDTFLGTPGGENTNQLAGDDRASAGPGDDCVFGDLGNDAVSGNEGEDSVSGGEGNDRVFGRAGNDAVSGNAGDDEVEAGSGDDRAFGRDGNDKVRGGTGNDVVLGEAGEDGVSGNEGDDKVRGGTDDDRVFGREGNDGLSGNEGDDLLDGGPGTDRLFGREGNDRIVASDGTRDMVDCGPGRDTVVADRADRVRNCEKVTRLR